MKSHPERRRRHINQVPSRLGYSAMFPQPRPGCPREASTSGLAWGRGDVGTWGPGPAGWQCSGRARFGLPCDEMGAEQGLRERGVSRGVQGRSPEGGCRRPARPPGSHSLFCTSVPFLPSSDNSTRPAQRRSIVRVSVLVSGPDLALGSALASLTCLGCDTRAGCRPGQMAQSLMEAPVTGRWGAPACPLRCPC